MPLISLPTCHISFEQNTQPHTYRIPDYNTHYYHSYDSKENLFAYSYATDTDRYYMRKNEIINQLETLVDGTFNYLYTTQKRDIIKQGTSIITEGMLLTKIFIFAHNLSKNLLPPHKKLF